MKENFQMYIFFPYLMNKLLSTV